MALSFGRLSVVPRRASCLLACQGAASLPEARARHVKAEAYTRALRGLQVMEGGRSW